MVIQRSILPGILLLLLATLSLQTISSPIASIDRSVISIDDTLTLTLRINESGSFNSPDLSPLNNNFHVLGNSQSSRHMIRNGRSESWTEWIISLAPKRKGQLTIPPIDIDGQKTQTITINVQPSVPVSAGQLLPVFLESDVDHDTVYVQQQVIFTVRIFQSVQLDNMNISEPAFDNAAMEKLGQKSFRRRVQNTPYQVHELRYAIFPQQAGELVIPELIFSGNEAVARRSVFSLPGQGKLIRKMSKQHKIQVKAPPPQFSGKTWLPASSIKLVETWSSSPGNIHVGDSITRTITVQAEGLMDSQLPPFEQNHIDGAKLYPDQGTTETNVSDTGVSSVRADSAAVIPTREGTIELPAITLNWWDTKKQQMQYATIPASTLKIKPALEEAQSTSTPLAIDHSQTNAVSAIQPAAPSSNSDIWQLISGFLALGWLLTLFLLWKLRQQIQQTTHIESKAVEKSVSEKQAFKALIAACRTNDAHQLRPAIIHWGRSYWPQYRIQSLQDIRQHCAHASLKTALMQLDNALYGLGGRSDDWNSENILSVIKLIRENDKKESKTEHSLNPLYSN